MYKEKILKQWSLIFKSSLIFYLGVILVGLLPTMIFEEFIWERNLLLTIIGLLLGATIFIGLIVMIVSMLLAIWPVLRKFDYVYMGILFLTLLVLDIGETVPESLWILFVVVAVIVFVLQFIARRMIEQTNEEDLEERWQKGMERFEEVDVTKKMHVTRIMTSLFVMLLFVAYNDTEQLTDQVITALLVFALGLYTMMLFYSTFKIPQKYKLMNAAFFSLMYAGIMALFYVSGAFFMNHIVLKSLLVLLPFAPLLYVVVPHFYMIIWTEKNQNMHQ